MKRLIYTVSFLLLLLACQKDEVMIPVEQDKPTETPDVSMLEGHIRVKFKTDVVEQVKVVKTKSGISSGLTALDLVGVDLSVYRMERVFPYGGKFEERHIEAGLHLWYDIYFDEKISTRSAIEAYQNIPEIEIVEEVPEIKRLDYNKVSAPLESLNSSMSRTTEEEEEVSMPFNDPRLGEMWHYDNRGESDNGLVGALVGADIGVFKAWEEETGSRDVIVAVMDGGIQYDHPDLATNMWFNEAELNGQPNVDDDNNGYVDDIYGWNFVTSTTIKTEDGKTLHTNGAIVGDDHGTHCAGTIAGVTNNGIGISGIAGGSGNGDGVRLMSCQMFGEGKTNGSKPNMFVYAADMGAIISSNSWTGGSYPEEAFLSSANRVGIDYFIKYAGKDINTREQVGPMDGGLVVFASANSNSDVREWPAAYAPILTVSSITHNFRKAYYSNYGSWVDISTTGGETLLGESYGILSTITGSGYAWYQGTSMACPHAAGCVALILSKFQGQGYTPNELTDRTLNSAGDIDGYNSNYAGMLGVGHINVGVALTPPSLEAPASSELTVVDAYDNWAIVEWEVKEAPDGLMNKYVLSWSPLPFVLGQEDASGIEARTINVRNIKAGTILRDTVKELELGGEYHFSLQAFDRWGGMSEPSTQKVFTVIENKAPVLTYSWKGNVLLDEGGKRVLEIKVNDLEGQMVQVKMEPELSWVKLENLGDSVVTIKITPNYQIAGKYPVQFTISDQYGKASSFKQEIEVLYKEVAPQLLARISELNLVKDRKHTLNLTDYFVDPKGRELMYEVKSSNNKIVSVIRNGQQLLLDPKGNGRVDVQVRALNDAGLSVSQRFEIEVFEENVENIENMKNALTAYPNPVINELNLTLLPAARGEVSLKLYNAVGRLMLIRNVMIGDYGYSLNMSDMQGGTYTLVVENGVETWKKNIIKI